jgi:hypothetical protein
MFQNAEHLAESIYFSNHSTDFFRQALYFILQGNWQCSIYIASKSVIWRAAF